MPAVTIGEFSNSDLATHCLDVFPSTSNIVHSTILQHHEVEIFKKLVSEVPNTVTFAGATKEDVSELLNNHVMVSSTDNDANIAMTLEFQTGTPLNTQNKDYLEKLNLTRTNAPQLFTNTVALGADTSALYNSNIKFEYSDGPSTYTSDVGGHTIAFDITDADYNICKAINSILSNTAPNATNGIVGAFDEEFNSTHAFLTESILLRNTDNTITVGQSLGNDGISTALNCEIVASTSSNEPIFGALKFVQDTLSIQFAQTNNIVPNSTLSKLSDSTNLSTTSQSTATSLPDTSLTEGEFQALFTSEEFSLVGPGYSFNLEITAASTDGYKLDSTNEVSIPLYGADNTVTGNTSDTMFTIDDSALLENAQYMRDMKENSYFNNDSHKLYVQNGNFVKDQSHSTNANFGCFEVLDGVERLIATNDTDIADLSKKGSIIVINSNNILGDVNARYNKYTNNTYTTTTANHTRVDRLVVSYDATESDYSVDSGIMDSTIFQQHYYVQSEISTLNNSTNSSHNAEVFSPELYNTINAARANNSVLVFQSSPNSPLYNSSNISGYQATGLDSLVEANKFALLSLDKTLSFEDSDEALFKTSDNATIAGVVSNISITNIDLNSFNAQDLRVLINAKQKTDMPAPSSSSWLWATGNEIDGNLSGYNNDSNGGFLVSEKAGLDYLKSVMYEVSTLNPTQEIAVVFKLTTNSDPVASKDILNRSCQVSINIPGDSNSLTINVENNDIAMFEISETTSAGVTQNLTGLQNIQPYYVVKKYTTIKEYYIAIRNRVGSYKNLWLTKQVKEFTYWYQLTNSNKNGAVMPDYFLHNILDDNGNQAFKASRSFQLDSGTETSSELSTTINVKIKDLMGFTISVEFNNGTTWVPFALKADSNYDHALDPMYDRVTSITLMSPTNLSQELGTMRVTVDAPMLTSLGLSSHISPIDNQNNTMYIINITVPQGSSSFSVKGYMYDVATDSQYFNKNASWSPYSVGDALFLRNNNNDFVGNQITNLTTLVQLIDPTPGNTTNVNEVNLVKVIVKQGSNELFSFISNKMVLENFNIICQPQVIVQHDYLVSKTSYDPVEAVLSGTEYVASTYVLNALDVVNLNFGDNHKGIRLEVKPASTTTSIDRVSIGFFRLNGDRVQIKLLDEDTTSNSSNIYTGRYSHVSGEEIIASGTGAALPTTSSVHRNVKPIVFRGYKNNQPKIDIIRTMTTCKLVVGDKYMDPMHSSDTNASILWADRSTFNGQDATLRAMKLYKATSSFTTEQLDNMDIIPGAPLGSNGNIGSLGLKFTPRYSMFPGAISSTLQQINVLLSPSSYNKTIGNPLGTSLNVSVSSDLLDFNLQQFRDFALVATRIKVYSNERYKFDYSVPGLMVYHSSQYIGDPRSITTWTYMNAYTDEQLRDGVVVGSGSDSGVIKFTKSDTFVSSFIKFAILPRPTARLSSYDVSDLTARLPDNFVVRTYTRRTYGVDINLSDANGLQGFASHLQQNRPFDKTPLSGVPNQVNAVPSSRGLNNLTLGFNAAKYLYLREPNTRPAQIFSFALSSNKIKLSSGVGLTANSSNYTVLFDDYISHLSDSTKWNTELASTIDNSFDVVSKKWHLNMRQLRGPIANFITLAPTSILDNHVSITGVTSFGMASYTLDLTLLDSVKIRTYKVSRVYDSDNDIQKFVLYRYSSAEGLAHITGNDFSESASFRPLNVTKETCEVQVSVPNILTNVPYNVNTLIINAFLSTNFTGLSWTPVTPFTSIKSSINFVTLSITGAGSFLELLQVTKERPFKVLTCTRPYILDVKRADGSRAFAITYDGKVLSHRLATKRLELLPEINFHTSPFDFLTGPYNENTVQTQNDD